jgi:adenosine deaminase
VIGLLAAVLCCVYRAHFQNLQSFLDAYQVGLTALVTQQDFYELAAAYLEKAAANNIKHAEIFFDVQSHVKR